jgi:uncharacterized membrane protein YoaK (UPF0700 family)
MTLAGVSFANPSRETPMPPIHRSMAPALSFNGGFVDTIGFLALQGLFTAHVTGNFVTLGVSIVHGTSGALAKLLALPVFALVVGLSHIAAVSINRRGLTPLRPLLILHTLLLAVFAGLAIWLGPFTDGDSNAALLTGMIGVSAMAIQNAISRQHLKGAPPTTLMTGNVTQGAIDVFALIGLRDAEQRTAIIQRLKPIGLNLLGFTVGCVGAALLYLAMGLWCLTVPVLVAIWTCIRTFGSDEALV